MLLETKLHSALEELETAKLITKLLQEEIRKVSPRGDRDSETINTSKDMSAKVYSKGLENNKLTLIPEKCRRKGLSPKNLNEKNNTYPLYTTNRYNTLTNLQDTLEKDNTLKTQDGSITSAIPNCYHQTELQPQSRGRIQRIDKENKEDSQTYHTPTLLNGKIGNNSTKTMRSIVTRKKNVTKKKLRQHNVTMIGDSFLRGIRENVETSLTDKFGIYSVVKPGCDLNNLLETAKSAAKSVTHKDVIFICGGSNDFNYDKDKSAIDHIMDHIREFIRTNNHINIILATVPTRYDLSYYSKVNKDIRSYNERLRDITKLHKQVALIDMDIDRRYHTRHGLHFNKLGKLLFANKITQMIHLTLSNKQKKNTVMNGKYRNQGDESEADGKNSNRINKDIRNIEDRTQTTQHGADKKDAEQFNQDKDENTSNNNDDKNENVRFNQTINKVILTQELECDEVNKGVNKTVICEHPQDIPGNTQPKIDGTVTLEQSKDTTDTNQSDCADKILETRRISTRNKKTPSTRGNDFLW